MQIFLSSVAYLFVYDLDSLPKSIARYFYPVSLERPRAVVPLLMMNNNDDSNNEIRYTPDAINTISEELSRQLIMAAKSYESSIINHGDEKYI